MTDLTFDVVALDRASQTFLKMAAQVERLSARIDKLDGKNARITLTADDRDLNRGLDSAEAKRKRLDGKSATVNVNAKVDKSFADATITVERMLGALRSFALPVGIAAAIPLVATLGVTAAQASTSLLLLPAAGAAAGAVMGTVKVATIGMSDAFKQVFAAKGNPEKLAQALAQLSPNARSFALEVAGLRPELTGLQHSVQDAAFLNLNTVLGELARAYLPMARTQMTGLAREMNLGVQNTAAFVASAGTVRDVEVIFNNTRSAVTNLNTVGISAVSILRDIAAVGSDFLPGLAAGFAECADNAARFVHNARESGQLHDWISAGLSVLGSLAQALINVGVIVFNVFRAAHVNADGFAKDLVSITQRVKEWTASAEGQERIAQVFSSLSDLARGLLPLVGAVALAIINMVNTIGPAMPGLGQGLADVLAAAAPLTSFFGQLAAVLLTALGPALSFLAPVLGPLLALIIAASTATKVWSVAVAVAGGVQKAYTAAVWLGQAAQLAYMLVTQSGTRALVLMTVAQRAMNLAMAMNPIGLVVIAIMALVAGLVLAWNHSETFRSVVMAAWDGIKAAAAAAWEFLQGVFAAIPGALAAIGGFFTGLWTNYVVPAWGGIVATVQAAWQGIQSAGETAWGVLQVIFSAVGTAATTVGAFFMSLWRDYVQPAFDGIIEAGKLLFTILATVVLAPIVIAINIAQAAFGAFRDFAVDAFHVLSEEAAIWWGVISGIFNFIVDYLDNAFTPKWLAFKDQVIAAWTVVSDFIGTWVGIIIGWWNAGVTYLETVFMAKWVAFRDYAIASWQAVSDYIASWWAFIQALWAAIGDYLVTIFLAKWTAFRDYVVSVWNALSARIAQWWAEAQAIWNAIIAYLEGIFVAKWTAFRDYVVGVWNALWDRISQWWNTQIQPLFNIIMAYVVGPFIAGFNTMRDGVIAAWNFLRDGITAVWNWIRDNVFNPIVNFVTVTIPDGFRRGVGIIRSVWDGVKQAMRDPIQAAINIVYNNGIVWVFNKVAETVGISTRLPTYNLPNFAQGGEITGGTPGKDSVLLKGTPGEYVFSVPAVQAAGGLDVIDTLHRMLVRRRVGGMIAARPLDDAVTMPGLPIPAFQGGGPIGGTTATGSASTAVQGSAQATTNFGDWWNTVTGYVSNLAARVGGSPWAQLAVGLGRKVADLIIDWGKKKIADWLATMFGGGGLGGGIVAGQVGAMMAVLRAAFPGLALISGYRPGAITATGNQSYHALGRAVDVPPRWDVFNWIKANYGGNTKELIFSPAGAGQIWNGRPHFYGEPTRGDHWDHVHWAMANGGIVRTPTFGLLGEAGPEVVLPLNRPRRAAELAGAAGYGAGETSFHVHVITGPNASAEDIIRAAMREARLARLSGRFAPAGRA